MSLGDLVPTKVMSRGISRATDRASYAKGAFDKWNRPLSLIVAEMFLLFIVGIYFTKICIVAMGLYVGHYKGMGIISLTTYIFEIAMMFIAMDAMLGISSRKPKAWRKVVRSSILLFLISAIAWYGEFTGSASLVTLNPLLIAPFVVIVLLIMFMPKVRRYYVPPMMENRPMMAWVKFILFTPLYTSESYRIMH